MTEIMNDVDVEFNENLEKLYNQLNEQNRSDKRKKLKIPNPKTGKVGGARTLWENFGKTAVAINRPIDHMHKFFTSELSTDCSITSDDQTSKLVIKGKGRYTSAGLIKILDSYLDNYVQCKVCGEMDTNLMKEQRQYFILCKCCLSKWCCQIN
jgi:translation initiation factor 2 subunit 2